MTDYYHESLNKLKIRYGNYEAEKIKCIIYILVIAICAIPVTLITILFSSAVIEGEHQPRGRYAEDKSGSKETICGLGYIIPDGWIRVGRFYYAEMGGACSMIDIEECGDDELKNIVLDDGLSEEEANRIYDTIYNDPKGRATNIIKGDIIHSKREGIDIYACSISFDFVMSDKDVYGSIGEIYLLYNSQNSTVSAFSFLQSGNVERDHTEEFYRLIDSIYVME